MERQVAAVYRELTTASGLHHQSAFLFQIPDSQEGETYTADIRTASGWARQVTGLVVDRDGIFYLNDANFLERETNFVRVRNEAEDPGLYSGAVTVLIDPTIVPGSENQINRMAVSRVGTDVIVRWTVLEPTPSTTRLYYDRQDGGGIELLTPNPLDPPQLSYTVEEQSLPTNCVLFSATQDDGGGESGLSPGVVLPPSAGAQDLALAMSACDYEAPSDPGVVAYLFADQYHHRDHLGSLRVVTDAGGRPGQRARLLPVRDGVHAGRGRDRRKPKAVHGPRAGRAERAGLHVSEVLWG